VTAHSALIHWASASARGRKDAPATLRYVGISRFPEDPETWPDGSWSVELRFSEPPAEQHGDVCEAQVRFLFDSAPQERLVPGARFSLYEGPYKVADVEVLD
jgi:hypothetical protein